MTTVIDHRVDPRERGTVHTLTVNNPRKLNVLGSAAMTAFSAALDRIAEDDEARVVVVRGAGGKAWIGGADIGEMASLTPASAEAFIRHLHGVCRRLRDLLVPALAAIQGWCLGAGLEVAACCDLRLGTTDSHFGMPEVRVGLPSVIEAAVLPRLIGSGRTRDLVLTGRTVDAAQASSWGLLDGVAAPGALDALVEERVAAILEGAPGAVRAQKQLCRDWEELPLGDAIESGVRSFAQTFRGPEAAAYLQRFVNRKRDHP